MRWEALSVSEQFIYQIVCGGECFQFGILVGTTVCPVRLPDACFRACQLASRSLSYESASLKQEAGTLQSDS